MRPLMLEEQSQQSRYSFVRRTSQSTHEYLRHPSRRLTSELRANQRRHVSQFSSSNTEQLKILTADFFLDSSELEPLERFQKRIERSFLPLKPHFDETLETSLKDVEELLPGLPENELIELLRAFADKLDEMLYPPNDDALRIRIWGKRLEGLCRLLPSSPSEHSPKQALITRAQAMMNMLFTSISYVNSVEKWDDHNFHAAATVILAVAFHQNLFRSLQLILIETPRLSNSAHPYVRHIIEVLLSRTPNVSAVIPRAVQENWSMRMKRNLGYFLLWNNRDFKLVGDIITELQANNIDVSLSHNQKLQKTRNLLTTNDITTAQQLYDSIPLSDDYEYIYTGLYLAARAGNSKRAQSLFDKLKARGEANKRDIKNLLLSYAGGGDVREIYRVFNKNFPEDDEGRRLNEPGVQHYSVAILAHARVGDFDAVISWLNDMERSGLQPNAYIFGLVIHASSKTNDLQGLWNVIYKMRKLGAEPDVTVYTNLLRLYANRNDLESVESLYKSACENGIIPNLRMTEALMHAHVTSGSLKGAVRLFDDLSSQPRTSRYLPISIYNIVMKAHVSMGAPHDVVYRLFSKLKSMQLVDKYTYSLLVMSACASGHLHSATNIYYEMVKEEQGNPTVSLGSDYVLTMIMSALLRQGNKVQAKEIYDHMIKRGIRPSGVVCKEIVISYVKEGTPESLRSAEEFIKSLVSYPKEDRKLDKDESKRKPFHLYGLLLKFYGLQRNVDECERLYTEYLRAGGRPTVATLIHVLEAYRVGRKMFS